MLLTIEKLKSRLPEIAAAAVRAAHLLTDVRTAPNPATVHPARLDPPSAGADWRSLAPGETWGQPPADLPRDYTYTRALPPGPLGAAVVGGGSTHWLEVPLQLPAQWQYRAERIDEDMLLALQWEGTGLDSIEAVVLLDGQPLAGLDAFHRSLLLPAAVQTGQHSLLLRCYVPHPQPFGGLRLLLRNTEIFQLGQVLRAALEAVETCPPDDPQRHAMLARLNEAYNLLDLRAGWQSDGFAHSAATALNLLRHTLTAGLEPGPRPTLLATGHAHLDVAWLWPLWRTRQKAVQTVATALHLMERYPDYHFSMSQPQIYSYLREDAPELYTRLRERAAEGRFEPVGVMWIEADCNLPSGEALVRQFLHGARFSAEEFGVINHVVWLPDAFGYSAALPQLMRGCGIDCFVSTKLSWNQFNRMPADTFRWRGIDGSAVLAHLVSAPSETSGNPFADRPGVPRYTYNGTMTAEQVRGTWRCYQQQAINQELLYIYGRGDGGGGPTEEMLEAGHVFKDLPGFPQVQPGRVEQFFNRLHERVWSDPNLPTWVGELYLEYHRGTYTSQARTKQANRAAELLYREAEWLNAWAVALGGFSRQDELNEGWRLLLLNQFHDILPGSSIAHVYQESSEQYAAVLRIGQAVSRATRNAILLALEGKPDPAAEAGVGGAPGQHVGQSQPLADPSQMLYVFNSLPWQRADTLCLPLEVEPTTISENGDVHSTNPAGPAPLQFTDAEGQALLTQLVSSEPFARHAARLTPSQAPAQAPDDPAAPPLQSSILPTNEPPARALLVDLVTPAYGYTCLRQDQQPPASAAAPFDAPGGLQVAPDSLANGLLQVTLDVNGELASLYDQEHERELIPPGTPANQLVAYEDRPLFWDAWDIEPFYTEKAYPVRAILDWRVVETGPLRAAIEITQQVGQSLIRQRICLWHNRRRIDFVTEVDWQERQTLLRALFPLALNVERATCEIQFGALERPTHRNTSWEAARFEVCAQRWVALHEGGYGVALLNTGKYGHSLHHNLLGLSLLRGSISPDPDADRGYHCFTYSLLPYAGDWRAAGVVRRAYELNAPLQTVAAAEAPRTSTGRGFLSTPTEHIVVETVKVAEDGDGLIIRLYEAHNQRGPASLVFGQPVEAATEVDLLERSTGRVVVEGRQVHFAVRPFEVKTLRVWLKPEGEAEPPARIHV